MMWIHWPKMLFWGYGSCANGEENIFPLLKVSVENRESKLWLQEKMDNGVALALGDIPVLQETKVYTLSMLGLYEKSLNQSHHLSVRPRG